MYNAFNIHLIVQFIIFWMGFGLLQQILNMYLFLSFFSLVQVCKNWYNGFVYVVIIYFIARVFLCNSLLYEKNKIFLIEFEYKW